MKVVTHIYTSCYSKMLKRHKIENRDFYIQVSRSLFYPRNNIDGKPLMDLIDLNYGPTFGMYASSLKEYEQEIRGKEYKEYLDELAEWLTGKTVSDAFESEDIAGYEEVIKELEEWKKELIPLSVEDRIQEYENEYPTQEDKDSLACFNFSESDLEHIEDWKIAVCLDYYFLCFEDLDSKYTAKDEEKYPDCKAGTFKKCHRTILAKVLKEMYGLKIDEWREKKLKQIDLF